MRLLDLFCKAGGAAVGYHRAGFDVVGVDIVDQPRYPFEFHRADALVYLAAHGHEFDVIHASPPCQGYSTTRTLHGNEYPLLVGDVRRLLKLACKPYVIENVPGAPLIDYGVLCGAMFGLKVFRHRLFETSGFLLWPPHPQHDGNTGSHRWPYQPVNGYVQVTGNGGNFNLETGSAAMGIDWMTKEELAEAIPPAYTEFIGRQLIAALEPAL